LNGDEPAQREFYQLNSNRRRHSMMKTIALASFAASLALAPVGAVAQAASGYGTHGTQQGTSTFDRAWNASHESKTYTYETANAVRHHVHAPRYHRSYQQN
jgi:hypothetical protein